MASTRPDNARLTEQFRLPRFQSREEAQLFRAQVNDRKFSMRRFFLFFGALAFLAHGALDIATGADDAAAMFMLRIGCVAAMIVLSVLFAKRQSTLKPDTIIALYLFAPAITIIAMTAFIEAGTAADTYPYGLVILFAYGATTLSLRCRAQIKVCSLIYCLYLISIPFSATGADALIVNLFFVTIGLSAICIGSLAHERLERQQFRIEQSFMAVNEELSKSRREALMARDVAIDARKTQAKFIASISHELRTPLNAILGFSDFMLNEINGPVMPLVYRDYVADINRSGNSLLLNINDMLDIQRLSSGKMSWTDARFSVDEMISHGISVCWHEAVDARVQIINEDAKDPPDAFGDTTRLTQVITNLLTNAIKFTDPGGTVTIKQHFIEPNGDYCITVTDTGIGIAEDDLERIQTPFQQAEDGTLAKKKGGLGLGLAIVSGILAQIDGRFEMESELGVGTTCRVIIPRHKLFLEDEIVSVA